MKHTLLAQLQYKTIKSELSFSTLKIDAYSFRLFKLVFRISVILKPYVCIDAIIEKVK